jgi:hypothetical protein
VNSSPELAHLREVVQQFSITGQVEDIQPFGSGHINDTFRVRMKGQGSRDYLLQRINHHVFKDVPVLMNNIRIVTDHLRARLKAPTKPVFLQDCYTYLNTREGSNYFRDDAGHFWRMTYFIPESKSYDILETADQALSGGRAYGMFLNLLSDLPADHLGETIPAFHDVCSRLQVFDAVLHRDACHRAREAPIEIALVQREAAAMTVILDWGRAGRIHLRVTHNDTKFNNILFDKNDRVLAIVDLDTVMPGYIHYDFGDAIRSGANTAAEDEADLAKISMDINLFASFARGFLEQTKYILNKAEIEQLAFSAQLMTYIIGLRFLTDYLDGDRYYKIRHPGHNLQRARAQFQLLRSMQEQHSEMEKIIRQLI